MQRSRIYQAMSLLIPSRNQDSKTKVTSTGESQGRSCFLLALGFSQSIFRYDSYVKKSYSQDTPGRGNRTRYLPPVQLPSNKILACLDVLFDLLVEVSVPSRYRHALLSVLEDTVCLSHEFARVVDGLLQRVLLLYGENWNYVVELVVYLSTARLEISSLKSGL